MSGQAPSATANYRRLLGYTTRYWPVAFVALLGMVTDAGCMTVFARVIKPMLDDLFIARDAGVIFWMPIVIVTIFLVRSAGTFATDYGTAYIGRGVVQTLRRHVFEHYLRLPASWFDAEGSGTQIARITYTAEQVAQASTEAVKVAVVDGLTVIGFIGVMLLASVRLTLTLLVMVPLVGALVYFVGLRYRRISRRIQGSMGTVTGVVEEVVAAHREVKVFGGQDYESRRFEEVTERTRRLNLKVAATNGLSTSLVQLIAAGSLALIVYFATRPAMIGQLTPGAFTSLILAMAASCPRSSASPRCRPICSAAWPLPRSCSPCSTRHPSVMPARSIPALAVASWPSAACHCSTTTALPPCTASTSTARAAALPPWSGARAAASPAWWV